MITSARKIGAVATGKAAGRREYLIDHFHVSLQDDSQWHCGCHEFSTRAVCRHTREAAGMRSAQADISRHLRTRVTGLATHRPRHR
jgi:hypothetical protein